MPLYETPALIVRSIKLGEYDKIVTFFTLKFGKIKVVAKGCVKPKSRFMGRLEPFGHVNLIAFGKEGATLFRLNSCDIIEPFIGMRNDFDLISRAYVSAELVDVCQKERDVNRQGYTTLLGLWRGLDKGASKPRQDIMLRIFELKYLASIGFRPMLEKCVDCGGAVKEAEVGFNPEKGGVVCADCLGADPAALRTILGAVRLMSKSLNMPLDKVARLSAGIDMAEEVGRIVNGFIEATLRRGMKSERFLKL